MDQTARQVIIETARANAPDYYIAATLAPRSVRDDLIVLAAFEGELDRVPDQSSEPMVAEIRLQWWRDVIASMQQGALCGHPIADALGDVIVRHRLDQERLIESVDARSMLEEDASVKAMAGVSSGLRARDFNAMARAANVLGAFPGAEHFDGLEQAGLALSFARMALVTRARLAQSEGSNRGARHTLQGEMQLARDNLDQARAASRAWPSSVRLAALPVALVEPYLRACEEGGAMRPSWAGRDAILPLTRVWRLWRCARTGRF